MKFKIEFTTSPGGGCWVLDFTRLMLISTQVEVGVEVGVELGNTLTAALMPRDGWFDCTQLLQG